MAGKKTKMTNISFEKEDIDPAIKELFFDVCKQRDLSRGKVINELMEQFIMKKKGPIGGPTQIRVYRESIDRRQKSRDNSVKPEAEPEPE